MSKRKKEYNEFFEDFDDPFKGNNKRRKNLYEQVFGTEEGKLVYLDLMRQTAIHRTPYHPDSNQANLNMGKQLIGFHLKQWVEGKLTRKVKEETYNDRLTDDSFYNE